MCIGTHGALEFVSLCVNFCSACIVRPVMQTSCDTLATAAFEIHFGYTQASKLSLYVCIKILFKIDLSVAQTP